jgi:hypothetical protein
MADTAPMFKKNAELSRPENGLRYKAKKGDLLRSLVIG